METTVFLDTVNLHRFFIYVWVLERSNPGWNATLATLEILRAHFTLWDVSQCTKVSGTVHKHAPRAMVWQEVLNSNELHILITRFILSWTLNALHTSITFIHSCFVSLGSTVYENHFCYCTGVFCIWLSVIPKHALFCLTSVCLFRLVRYIYKIMDADMRGNISN